MILERPKSRFDYTVYDLTLELAPPHDIFHRATICSAWNSAGRSRTSSPSACAMASASATIPRRRSSRGPSWKCASWASRAAHRRQLSLRFAESLIFCHWDSQFQTVSIRVTSTILKSISNCVAVLHRTSSSSFTSKDNIDPDDADFKLDLLKSNK